MKFLGLTFLIATAIAAGVTFTGSAAAQNPVPLINQPLVPDATKPGGAEFTLTVNGTGFVSGSVVHWNDSARATTFVSPSKVTANILASDIAKPTTASVTVFNPTPGGGTSNVAFFEVTPPTSSVGLAANSYAIADRSYGVVVGDFNRDGKLDLAVVDYAANAVSVLLGNGDGTFQAHVEYATGRWPETVAVGDFNGDGKLDLVVANSGDNDVSVLLGNGDGTFQPTVNYSVGAGSVAVGDFNRDGKLDLAVTDSNGINVLLGNGDGTFQPAVKTAVAGAGAMAVGDFNRDGNLDLVVADYASNDIKVLLGNGDGKFQLAGSYSTGPGPDSVAVADLNGDGMLDLVVATNGSTDTDNNTVSILLGNGDGTFRAHVDYDTGSSNPSSVAVGDFNGDGKLDLVVADLFSTDVRLLLGNGDGTFGTAASYAAGAGPSSVAVGDFNDDGRLDIAVADAGGCGGGAGVSVLLSGAATVVVLNPDSLTFGEVQVGQTTSRSTTLTNRGTKTLSITGITFTGTDSDEFSQVNTCGSRVGAGQSCTITVTFRSTEGGGDSANLSISDNGGGSPQHVGLCGSGKVVQHYVCDCGGPCNAYCRYRRCGCHYTSSSGALLEEDRSSRASCNANWSGRLPELREWH